jgi:hypothetical protein
MFSKRISIRRLGHLLARFEEAAKEEEVSQGRGRATAPPEGPEADDGEEEAEPGPEQYQPEPEQLPPPPPNLVDVMALQTQLMQRMAESMEHRGYGGNRNAPPGEDLTKKSRSSSA